MAQEVNQIGIPRTLSVPSGHYVSNRINMALDRKQRVQVKALQLHFVSQGERLADGRLVSNNNYTDTIRRMIELVMGDVDIEYDSDGS